MPAFGHLAVDGQKPDAGQSPSAPEAATDSAQQEAPAVAERVLSGLRLAILSEDPNAVLSRFDAGMPGYSSFSSTVRALFARFTAFRVRYHILQTAEDHGNAATVEFTLEATPVDGLQPAVQRTQQIRFKFTPSGKGWKIAGLEPRDFFSTF